MTVEEIFIKAFENEDVNICIDKNTFYVFDKYDMGWKWRVRCAWFNFKRRWL